MHQVFAYLPTREYGLRFMVNADFIVTTSRYGRGRTNVRHGRYIRMNQGWARCPLQPQA